MLPVKEWFPAIKEFSRETKSELKKVSWPSRQEVISTTGVVIGAVIVFGIYLWVCDIAFYRAITFLFKQFGANIT